MLIKTEYKCGNCGELISYYRYKHSDKLCKECWLKIYGRGINSEEDLSLYSEDEILEKEVLGDVSEVDIEDEKE